MKTFLTVTVVISIIVAVAVLYPQYGGYGPRAKMAEVILVASTCSSSIRETIQSLRPGSALPAGGKWGCESRVSGTHPITKYVQKIETSQAGEIKVTISSGISAALEGRAVILKPWVDAAGTIVPTSGSAIGRWDCGGDGQHPSMDQYLPGSCRAKITTTGQFAESGG